MHVYNRFDRREEVYDTSDVVDLSAEKSLENAQNFAYYAAGESVWICYLYDADGEEMSGWVNG